MGVRYIGLFGLSFAVVLCISCLTIEGRHSQTLQEVPKGSDGEGISKIDTEHQVGVRYGFKKCTATMCCPLGYQCALFESCRSFNNKRIPQVPCY